VVRSFNGKDAGWVTNPFAGKDTPEAMSADEVKDAMNEADFDGPLVDAKAKGNTIELAGTERVEGRDAYILKVTHKDGQVSSYSFDTKTFLLAKWSGADSVNGETVTRETYFHDYREIGGLKFAFEFRIRRERTLHRELWWTRSNLTRRSMMRVLGNRRRLQRHLPLLPRLIRRARDSSW
jgi:hypothetical protein